MAIATGTALALGAAGSLAGSIMQGRAADRAMDAQGAAMAQQLELGREGIGVARDRLNWNQGAYDHWRQEFDPVLQELKQEALASKTPDYARITADASQAFQSQRQAGQRQMERYGINPGDGMWGANNRQAELGQASAEVMARQAARRDAGNQRYAQLAGLYGIGSTLQGQAMSGVNSGYGGVQSAYGALSSTLGGQAGTYGNQASAFGQQAGQLAGNAFQMFGNMAMGGGGGGGGGGPWDTPFYEGGPSGW